MKKRILGLTLALACYAGAAETAPQGWAQHWNGSGNNTDVSEGIAVDSENKAVVTGYSLSTSNGFEIATMKYSPTGSLLWTHRYNGEQGIGGDYPAALGLDRSNCVIVAGSVTIGTNTESVVFKLSPAGVPLWTNRFRIPNANAEATCLAIDRENNAVAGIWAAGVWRIIKYAESGLPLWTNQHLSASGGYGRPQTIAVDSQNNILVAGDSGSGGAALDYVTIKYAPGGAPLWTNIYNGPANSIDSAYSCVVDRFDNVIVTGRSTGSQGYGFGTIKYSAAGSPLWTNRYNHPTGTSSYASVVVVDSKDDVIVTGDSYLNSYQDFATLKYSSAGVPLWTNRFSEASNGYDIPRAMAVDAGDNIIVAGTSTAGYVVIKYGAGGQAVWTNRYTSGGALWSMTMDFHGDILVTGQSKAGASGFDYATVKYHTAPMIKRFGAGGGAFDLELAYPGRFVVEGSPGWTGWMPVFTNSVTTNVLRYAEPAFDLAERRMYRVRRIPVLP